MFRILAFASALTLLWQAACSQAVNAAEIDFGRDIKPLLARRCFACHGPDEAEAGLRFDKESSVTKPLESGATAVVPGKVGESELLKRVQSDDPSERMPPEGKPLSDKEQQMLEQWVKSGAKWEGHWAFLPISDPAPPTVQSPALRKWATTDIDRFIASRWEGRELTPAAPADARTMVRRAYFNLIGLPPTIEETEAFVQRGRHDNSQDNRDNNAWEQLIDQLLESPQYGEQWARHWLDVVRYAETNSFERDGVKPNAWKFRDYVIRSLNEDKPYDRFLIEQLAGDELPDATIETITATGYYRLGIWDDEPADPELARYDELDDIITVTGQGMLGLTMNCARCHDHKIDPIPQQDYYAMLAFFQGLTPYGTRGNQTANNQWEEAGPDVMAKRRDWARRRGELQRDIRKIEQRGIAKMSAPDQRATEGPERAAVLKAKLQGHLKPDQWERRRALKAELATLEKRIQDLPAQNQVLAVAKCDPQPKPTHVLQRGNPQLPGEAVQPQFPGILGGKKPSFAEPADDARSSGRRLVLANWIASDNNFLTARVIVNRVWQFHFGKGIVASPNNFGLLGSPPTHPQLLDYLASRLIEDNWSLKSLHKRIMMTSVYRLSSRANKWQLERDPSNQLLARFDMRRLSAEEVRDGLLVATGSLNRKMYGPSFYPKVSREVMQGQSRPGAGWGNSSPEEQNRRSVYIHIKRSLVPTELAVFDFPETDRSCEARFVTIQPAQALTMLNSEFIHEQGGAPGQASHSSRSDWRGPRCPPKASGRSDSVRVGTSGRRVRIGRLR